MEPEFKKGYETQVLIAGAGPVGLALALELGWRGIRCLLVEQKDEFAGNPKAKTVHQRTLELFRRWGLRIPEKLRAAAPLGPDFSTHLCYEPNRPAHYRAPRRSAQRLRKPVQPGAHTANPQSYLEPVLREEIRKLSSVEFRTGWKLRRCTEDGQSVRAEVVHTASGQLQQVAAAYLAGCDGGRSLVRKELGIRMRGSAVSAEALGGVFRASALWENIPFEKAFHYNINREPGLLMRRGLVPPITA